MTDATASLAPPLIQGATTMIDLDAIELREQAATEGPWDWKMHDKWEVTQLKSDNRIIIKPNNECTDFVDWRAFLDVNACDREFIAAARSDIPAMIDWIKRAQIAMHDIVGGWRYIRQFHGDLYGVGWDRAQDGIESVLAELEGHDTPEEQPR